MTRRVTAQFRVGEFADGQPFIVLEPLDGDELNLFRNKSIGFDLRRGTTYEEAQEIVRFLQDRITHISETEL
jgi:hypothetical protein